MDAAIVGFVIFNFGGEGAMGSNVSSGMMMILHVAADDQNRQKR